MVSTDRDHLAAQIARVGAAIDRLAGAEPRAVSSAPPGDGEPALERLCRLFGLTAFERDVLIAAVGVELDPEFARRCAAAQRNPLATRLTLSLAFAAFGGGHLSTLAPTSALRKYKLVTFPDGASPLVSAPLAVDERILCYVLGVPTLDARIDALAVEVSADAPASRQHEVDRLARAWQPGGFVVALAGASPGEREGIACAASARSGRRLFRIRANELPLEPTARHGLRRTWEREALLLDAALLLELDPDPSPEVARAATLFLEDIAGIAILSCREPLPIRRTDYIGIDLRTETSTERRDRWQRELGPAAAELDGALDRVAAQFHLSPSAATRARLSMPLTDAPLADRLWDACRVQARPRLDELARRIEPIATWEDLVLPDDAIATLREVAVHLRQRYEVYERWGFAARASRGLGTGAMFEGPSGTGKTLAAEVLASEARLDLYHIDLSQVVNKYVGETEKNLRRVFDAAEEGGSILLFDEADALFGKRGDVEKGTDRYANLEISYLLQRMEQYRGLAILTTNQKSAVDTAFLRRLRFVVSFAFPDVMQRVQLWQRAFPAAAPIGTLEYKKLARLKIAGGNIRNIALNAAFAAADRKEPISMRHLLHAARAEYDKLERPFPEADVIGWSV